MRDLYRNSTLYDMRTLHLRRDEIKILNIKIKIVFVVIVTSNLELDREDSKSIILYILLKQSL